jgi:death-on-curing protein
VNYLDITQVLAIHYEVTEQVGGAEGVRDLRLLDSAIARPQASYGGDDLYPDIFSKAAALVHSLISNHPFIDGNKRTGYMAMRLFLNLNGYDLKASLDERYNLLIKIAEKMKDEESITRWLKAHTQKV